MHEWTHWTKECQCKLMHTHIQNSCHSLKLQSSKTKDYANISSAPREESSGSLVSVLLFFHFISVSSKEKVRAQREWKHFFLCSILFILLSQSMSILWHSHCVLGNCDMCVCMCMIAYYVNFFFRSFSVCILYRRRQRRLHYCHCIGENNGHWNACSAVNKGPNWNVCLSTNSLVCGGFSFFSLLFSFTHSATRSPPLRYVVVVIM